MRTMMLTVLLAGVSIPAVAAPEPPRAWVAASNANTRLVVESNAQFSPEDASQSGLSQYDGLASDLGPRLDERKAAAAEKLLAELRRRAAAEKDANVRQDLAILIRSVEESIEGRRLRGKYFVAWVDAPEAIYSGLTSLLDDQIAPARRKKAVELLQRYVGDWPGTTPLTQLAKARFAETNRPGLLGPDKVAVDDALNDAATYVKGVRELFAKYRITGADAALAKLDAQAADYVAWERANVLPIARADFRLPPEVYAFRLKQVGIDIPPEELISRAQVEFAETRAALAALAPQVARTKGWTEMGYPAVIRRLKQSPVPNDKLEASYAEVIRTLETVIRRERIVNLPDRPMQMRLGTAAESAASPAPHMDPPALLNNQGEHGTFVLPIGVAGKGAAAAYDDFNFPAAEWTVAAHEGRPGHELQFSAMIERGVSQARALYAFNSVNVEGWALYAEAEAAPYHPLEGQMIVLQMRLLRAARAMLDPMLNLGRISIDEARRVLLEEVCTSPAMAKQELDRYTSRSPGQAGSYFYGYTRLLQLRVETELALGPKFDRLAFNNFVIDQGLLPPELLAKAVREEFVPAQRAR
ncbi:DUF885 domain-containing protein [Sphingomonas aracearum]|uniref:DUF885 domain-containing protein n=1 Tax=Sphingomonas aracearum TaxID=2283317 RepID=A0A369VVC6_9SPHN|nr:DUF885 domain-containing protein [Sphingomonas aracearum]RDE06344.1 DUF885 domain-containing protein [Sphingomonas aracearum]